MFGSSQDRARQLAGRNRRERISSISSCSSHRSMSFSSRPSQQRNTPPAQVRTTEPTATIDERTCLEDSDASIDPVSSEIRTQAINEPSVLLSVPQLADGLDSLQVEQHRIQAEHLSRVLHSNLTLENVANLPASQFAPRRHTRYGSLGTHTDQMHHLRSITAPAPPTHLLESNLEDLLAILDVTRAPPLRASVSDHHLKPRPMVSLRGGSGGDGDIRGRDAPQASKTRAIERRCLKITGPMDYFSCPLDANEELLWYDRTGIPQAWLRIYPATWNEPSYNSYNCQLLTLETIEQKADHKHSYYSSISGAGAQTSSAAKTNLNKLFDRYQEAGAPDKDVVGVEGTMRYFEETGVDAEGLEALAALEIVQAPTMGEMSRDGFIKGWSERSCDSIDKQKQYLRNVKSEISENKELFTQVYKYTFTIAKTADQRVVPLEMATVYWELLFSSPLSAVKWSSPNTPWLSWWIEFLNTSWKKSVNKDMWNETLKFAQLSLEDESMSFWHEESSWPSVIDDFVEFVKKDKRGGTEEQPMDEDEL